MRTTRAPQEEGEYEYASNHQGKSGNEEAHIEPAILDQPPAKSGRFIMTIPREQSLDSYRGRPALMVAILVLATVGLVTMGLSARAHAYSNESSPEIQCALAREGAVDELRATLEPEEGATVPAGSPVTLSVRSRSPVSFAIASAIALLPNPDIDSGMGIPGVHGAYIFTSDKATTLPGTTYWDASIFTSGNDLPECTGFPPFSYTTSPRKLVVSLPTPMQPLVPPIPTPIPLAPVHAPVAVSIIKPHGFTIAHPTVVYESVVPLAARAIPPTNSFCLATIERPIEL